MLLIINNCKDFINGELLAHLYATGEQVIFASRKPQNRINCCCKMFAGSHDGREPRGGTEERGNAEDVPRL
jgi:hypothetical protein